MKGSPVDSPLRTGLPPLPWVGEAAQVSGPVVKGLRKGGDHLASPSLGTGGLCRRSRVRGKEQAWSRRRADCREGRLCKRTRGQNSHCVARAGRAPRVPGDTCCSVRVIVLVVTALLPFRPTSPPVSPLHSCACRWRFGFSLAGTSAPGWEPGRKHGS